MADRPPGNGVGSFDRIDADAIDVYRSDGVIRLRQAFAPEWISLTRDGIARNLRNPGRFFRDHTAPGAAGRYLFDFWTWPQVPEFRSLIFESPAGAIAGRLLGADRAIMAMDNWFLREAGATDSAPWHHDEPYFDFHGQLCILWLPLESVEPDDGLTFVRGSHRLGQLFAAEQFSDNLSFSCVGEDYAPMPDFSTDVWRDRLITCGLAPGDCLLFDFRTVHAATTPGRAIGRDSHRLTLRFAADRAIFRPRGPWTREISDFLIAQGQKIGAPLDCPLMPRVWQRGSQHAA